jgi:hypothetical protein
MYWSGNNNRYTSVGLNCFTRVTLRMMCSIRKLSVEKISLLLKTIGGLKEWMLSSPNPE